MFPAAYANTFAFKGNFLFLFQRFVEKKCWNEVQTCCRSATASRGTRCWRPTSPAPYSSLSASTFSRWSLFQSEFGNKNGLVCSPNQTWSILPQKILVNLILFRPNYPSISSRWSLFQSEFSNKNWPNSKEWLVSSTSKSSPYFWVKMEQFVCESSVLVKGGLLPMHSLACFDRIITLISFTTTTTYQINCPTKYKKSNST